MTTTRQYLAQLATQAHADGQQGAAQLLWQAEGALECPSTRGDGSGRGCNRDRGHEGRCDYGDHGTYGGTN